jgi:hypothetical protein
MTSPDTVDSLRQSPGWLAALEEARQGFSEGGLPVGACVVSKTSKILGRGHNMLVQSGTPQMHVCLSTLMIRLFRVSYKNYCDLFYSFIVLLDRKSHDEVVYE